MTARAQLLDALTPKLEALGLVVEDYARTLTPSAAPVAMLRFDALERSPVGQGLLVSTYGLILLSQYVDAGPADDELEDLTEQVTGIVDELPLAVVWTRAERAVFADTTPAVELTLTVTTRKVPA